MNTTGTGMRMGLFLLAGTAFSCSPEGPAGSRVYLASGMTDQVLVLDANDGRVVDSVSVDPRPRDTDEVHALVTARDGSVLYAVTSHGNPTIWKIDPASMQVIASRPLDSFGAGRLGLSPDGRTLLVPDYFLSGQGRMSFLTVVDAGSLEVTHRIEVCPAPHHAAYSPDGAMIAVACALSDEVVLLDATTFEVMERHPVGADPGNAGSPSYKPLNLAWHAAGWLAVGLHLDGAVVTIRPGHGIVGRLESGAGPAHLIFLSDTTLAVANRGAGTVSLIHVESEEKLRLDSAIGLGVEYPLALASLGQILFVSYEGGISTLGGVVAVDIPTATPKWLTRAGYLSLGIAAIEN